MNFKDLRKFAASCERLDVTVPEPILRGLELAAIAEQSTKSDDTAPLLSMSPDALLDRIESISIRSHSASSLGAGSGLRPGVNEVLAALGAEVRAATVPELEDVVQELQPQFDSLSAPLVDAVQRFGFTYATSSDDVINLDAAAAVDAWRAVRKSWFALSPIVSLRIQMSTLFDVAPTERDLRAAQPMFRGRRGPAFVDTSVMFAAGDQWTTNGDSYIEPDRPKNLDWLSLAAGGLRLNTPNDVLAKIQVRRARRLSALAAPVAAAQ